MYEGLFISYEPGVRNHRAEFQPRSQVSEKALGTRLTGGS